MKIPTLTLDVPNKNGRIYPKAVLEKALEKYIEEKVAHGRAMVVNRPPQSNTVDLQSVIGIVKGATIENNQVVVDIEFLPGLEGALEAKAGIASNKLQLRTSGVGSTETDENGNVVIQPDYEITTLFVTHDPA